MNAKFLIASLLFVNFTSYAQSAVEHYNLGIEKDKEENREEAIVSYSRAIEINSLYTKAYVNRGFDKLVLGDALDAITDLTKAQAFEKLKKEYEIIPIAGKTKAKKKPQRA